MSTVAEFEEEGLQVFEQGTLEVGLEVDRAFGETGELEHVGIANDLVDGLLPFLFAGARDHSHAVGRQAGPLVEQAAELSLQLANRPAAVDALVLVEGAPE